MGVQRSEMLSSKSWLTGLDTKGKLVPEACRALLRIYINVTYRNLTQVLTDQIRFNSWKVSQEICRDFMSSSPTVPKRKTRVFLGEKAHNIATYTAQKSGSSSKSLRGTRPSNGTTKDKNFYRSNHQKIQGLDELLS